MPAQMSDISADQVLAVLNAIVDPATGKGLADAGMVKGN